MPLIEGGGTPEHAWRAWLARQRWPHLDLASLRQVVVVAPHPDDETLGLGGMICLARAAGLPVDILAVTDGEASHPNSKVLGPAQLAERRVTETTDALSRLGAPEVAVHRLGLPDGQVARREEDLAGRLASWLNPFTACFVTHPADGHPDHEASGRVAIRACQSSGAQLFTYPIWAWHWAHPGDARLPWHHARAIPLPRAVLARKMLAMSAYRSQVQPLSDAPEDAAILPPAICERFQRDAETVFAH